MKVFEQISQRGHEQVTFFHYPEVGLKAIVAIHNTALGPALGGCRMRLYDDEHRALEDVLRLSEGMTYKSSIAGLDLGGGKSCLIADPTMQEGRRELFLKFGECLNQLAGRYITAEDMGTSVSDVMIMREVTIYAAGFAQEKGGSGDPSPWTALGVFNAMKAACQRRFGSEQLKGRRVAVQGCGHVGMHLLKLLRDAGAHVIVSDTVDARLHEAKQQFGAEPVDVEKIYDVQCDIYAPCAAGQTVNPETLKRLRCSIIAGAANNQLTDPSVYSMIQERKLLYCPDFVINSGGVISVGGEYVEGGWKKSWVETKVAAIAETTRRILDESDRTGLFPEKVAIQLAKERVKAKQESKMRQ